METLYQGRGLEVSGFKSFNEADATFLSLFDQQTQIALRDCEEKVMTESISHNVKATLRK